MLQKTPLKRSFKIVKNNSFFLECAYYLANFTLTVSALIGLLLPKLKSNIAFVTKIKAKIEKTAKEI